MKNNIIKNHALLRDIIALEPTYIKSVLITNEVWSAIRPKIKELQVYGLWYDVSQDGNKIYLRVRVNDLTQDYIESLL